MNRSRCFQEHSVVPVGFPGTDIEWKSGDERAAETYLDHIIPETERAS